MTVEPRIRVSALLRWRDRILLCRHEKPGKEYWLLPGGGVNSGESLVDALRRELSEEVGIDDSSPSKGRSPWSTPSPRFTASWPSTSSTSSSRATSAGRSLETVTSADAAVRGHRLFTFGELDEVVLHPPIQRFVARWRPGDPTVYLGPLWAP